MNDIIESIASINTDKMFVIVLAILFSVEQFLEKGSAIKKNSLHLFHAVVLQAGYIVLTNASPFRMDPLVPLLIPEVNADHSSLIPYQQKAYGWDGFIVANANCSSTSIVLPMQILHQAYGIESAVVVTLQAISGAGYPGVPSLDIMDNIIPYIGNEDGKLETEPRKMCGRYVDGKIEFADFAVSAQAKAIRTQSFSTHSQCV